MFFLFALNLCLEGFFVSSEIETNMCLMFILCQCTGDTDVFFFVLVRGQENMVGGGAGRFGRVLVCLTVVPKGTSVQMRRPSSPRKS